MLRVPFSSGHPGAWRTGETRPPLSIWSPEGAEPEVQLSPARRPAGAPERGGGDQLQVTVVNGSGQRRDI